MSRYIEYHDICSAIDNQQDGTGMTYEALAHAMVEIQLAPSIDIVRCQDCKYWVYNFNGCSRNPCTEPWYATDFCNYGEKESDVK